MKDYSIKSIHTACTISIISPTGGGKTHLVKNTLLPILKGGYDVLVIMSPTMKLSGDFDEFVEIPNKLYKVHSDFGSVVAELFESQLDIFKQWENGLIKKDQIPSIMVIFDDCITDKSLFNFKGVLDGFSTKNRHLKISMIVLSQRLSAIPRTLRLNSQYIIMFSSFNASETEQFLSQYTPRKYQKQFQKQLINIFREQYAFIFCNNECHDLEQRLWINGVIPIKLLND